MKFQQLRGRNHVKIETSRLYKEVQEHFKKRK